MQRSAPCLKNARRRLTIRPPLVPTTETAKPILKQRKPPADPGPAPFKNPRFSNLIIFLKLKKKIDQQQNASARCSRICCSQPRPPPPFHSCAPGPSARSGAAPGDVRRGARALVAVRPPRGRGEGARSRPCVRRTRAGLGARGREARGAPAAEGNRRAVQRLTHPRGSRFFPRARTEHPLLPWPRVGARRGRVSTLLSERPPHNGCERRERRVHRRSLGTCRVTRLAQCPAYCSERSVGRENCCGCYCSLRRRGPFCDIRTAAPVTIANSNRNL